MTRKSILMMGASALIFSGAAFTTALADDATPVRYDSQAAETRDLNNDALEQAQAQNTGDSTQSDDDDGPIVGTNDDGDALDDEDDGDDDTDDGVDKN